MRAIHPLLSPLSAVSVLASAWIALAGCGGSNAASDPAKAPATATKPAAGTPAGEGTAKTEPTTTTTALPTGGELQGAKLATSTHSEVETKGEGGPKAGPGHTSEPGRSAKDIQAVIVARRDDARACYDKALKDHPGIEGDLDIKFTIDPQGNVTDIGVDTTKSQILEKSASDCIMFIIRNIKFAPSPKGFETRAHYPFNFHPKQGKPGAAPDATKK